MLSYSLLKNITTVALISCNINPAVAFDAVGVYFLEGFGGTGKMFLINLVLAKIRSDGGIALSTVSSGIPATLLAGGTTAYSRFKIPIDIKSDSTCHILPKVASPNSLLRYCSFVGYRNRFCI